MSAAMRILLLGGTSEATTLARLVAEDTRFEPVLSLAGRTSAPAAAPVATRIGGFGGVDGLAHFLARERIAAVVDATHPFAARMSANAAAACGMAGVPLLALTRPSWQHRPDDNWIEVADMAGAAAALGTMPARVFLTIGRQELAAFAAAPQHHYVVRSIEPAEGLLASATLIRARGPFAVEDEVALMRREAIDVVVSKNAGGRATEAKIIAARKLGLPVVMVRRPDRPDVPMVETAEAALAWLVARHRSASVPSPLVGEG
ncbi:cobalt-precorrin-6A reductase [Chelatococcus daeguensis]|uniref:Cobalt-precorrin-6A reductase n=1 Tax=Chelatococcus daeguensis TaxID=444444 RepID=A0AAC9JQ93_9HYPH|nr:cobalt-precorrin-6A reductase [Chelatococcus daeguensis]